MVAREPTVYQQVLIDTHCHIHEPIGLAERDIVTNAADAQVGVMICVGTSEESSVAAIAFAERQPKAFAAVGVHPHDTKDGYDAVARLAGSSQKIVAIGEVGLDYFYDHSPRTIQIAALRAQLRVAVEHDLPVIFHVREAFADFWPILDEFPNVRGVLHSFTDTEEHLHEALERGLYVGVNGISTFTKDETQRAMFASIPLNRMVLETDAPFLTPAPYRGKINEPAQVRTIAAFHAQQRGVDISEIAEVTTRNALTLFSRIVL